MVDNQSFSRIKRRKGWHLTLWQPSIYWLVEDHDRKNKNFVFIIGKRAKNSRDLRKGQNGQIPSILEIFFPKTLFRNNIVIYHFLWYLSLVSSSTIFFNPTWPDDMESLIKKKKFWPFSTRAWWARVLHMIPESIKLGYHSGHL